MNKNLLNIIGILLLSMVAFSLTACSEDDEDNLKDLEPEKVSKLVGEWICVVDGEVYMIYNFKEDGTGIAKEHPYSEEPDIWYFQYTYNEETGILKMFSGSEDDDPEVSCIKFATEDSFWEYWVDENYEIEEDDPLYYQRVK